MRSPSFRTENKRGRFCHEAVEKNARSGAANAAKPPRKNTPFPGPSARKGERMHILPILPSTIPKYRAPSISGTRRKMKAAGLYVPPEGDSFCRRREKSRFHQNFQSVSAVPAPNQKPGETSGQKGMGYNFLQAPTELSLPKDMKRTENTEKTDHFLLPKWHPSGANGLKPAISRRLPSSV